MKPGIILSLLLGAALVVPHGATAAQLTPEELAKKQCRSVHLWYPNLANKVTAAIASCTVTETQPGTYFAILAWGQGYCGIQDWGDGRKVFIFSVWDPGDQRNWAAKPADVKESIRAKVLYAGKNTNVSRFGGEGTGARTLTGFDWQVGHPVNVKVSVADDDNGKRNAFTCEVQTGPDAWEKIATISTLKQPNVGENRFGAFYSFVEDFKRNYESAKLARAAQFGNIWEYDGDKWLQVTQACFSADETPAFNIDAGKGEAPFSFFLKTGNGTQNTHAKLWSWIQS